MAGLSNDSDRNPSDRRRRSHSLEKLRPPPGSRHYSSLSRFRSVTISFNSNHPMSKSKTSRLIVDSLQRRYPQPDAVQKKSESVRSSAKSSSKLRSIISNVFHGQRRRRSSSLSLHSSSSSSKSSVLLSAIHRRNSSLSSSSSSSRSSIGAKSDGKEKKKRQNSDGGGGSRGIIMNSSYNRVVRISRGNSLPRNRFKVRRRNGIEEQEEEERYELCKKKILMGAKCKPLNSSGKLRYDEDGVLVPEPLPP